MEIYSPVVPAVKDVKRLDEIRKSAKFHPSIWGDFFLSYNSDNTQISEAEEEEVAKQKEAVRELLAQVPEGSTYKMELIDLIQRLGVNYHFEKEIHDSLNYIHENSQHNDDEVRTTALRFRLLRQQGYRVPCDVFRKFTDGEGNFATALTNDVEGLLELYEASHLATRGEEILDRAMEFSSSHLQALLNQHLVGSVSLSKRVDEALKMPIRKTLTRLGARKFISLYQEDESRNELLLNFAKLDFNMVQKMHQRELSDATRWWKKLEVAKRMPYARDRVVECFFWIVGVYFEPCYATARRILSKAINMASIVDDTYEYATLDELQILTDAIQRWDVNETLEDSPPHVQMCYKALIQAYAEIEDEVVENFGGEELYRVQYAIEHVKQSAVAFFEEAKWIYNNSIPTVEEYMKVAFVTCGYMMLSTTSLVGVGSDRVSKADFDWIVNEPLIVRASCVICRLMDDLVGDEYEEKPSSVLCYMKQYVVSKDEARARLEQQVKDAWKDMNEECIEPRPASMQILTRVLNLGRVIHLLYREGDSYTDPNRSKEWVKMVFVDPI
uniref:Bicyclo-germacrene synthase n=1 Tax=Origanum vulgare TaxID=39352 RepID=BCGS_ORIVU|nr:RecName: Full=Bicyclo-germacrene synthase; AltName: Full=Allo-aromadendrene synthase; AltName: Full=Geraniol synthase; AltName: Full=Limonene synthase; AltName: Full=Terpene synthase 4; Short=OvTPS4; AltName: Full=Terpinolene synthase [Origanum vulgare]ADK73618.1 terpene synthase 4 [Origanum vulgare]